MTAIDTEAGADFPGWLTRVNRYFLTLDAGDIDAAVDCFAADVRYSRPGFAGDPPESRIEVRGRAALKDLFRHRRPARATRHRLERWATGEPTNFLAGSVLGENGERIASFLAECAYDEVKDLITEYTVMRTTPLWG